MGIFAQRGVAASQLGHCGTPIPITRDAAIPRPLFPLVGVLEYLPCAFPQEPLLVARLVTCRSWSSSMLSETPGRRLRARRYRAYHMACARHEGLGPFPPSGFLGAVCQIQGNTLHLAGLVALPFRLPPFSRATTERLTRPYSGGPVRLRRIPSQQATIARLPMPDPYYLKYFNDSCVARRVTKADITRD